MTERRTQAERRASSEYKLLSATADLIVERGLSNVTLTAIGERAGCSHALVNHHFGSKAMLIERLNNVVDDLYSSRIQSAMEGKRGFDSLSAFVEAYLALVTGPDPIARVQIMLWAQGFSATGGMRASRVEWDHRFRDGVTTLVRRALAETYGDVDLAATALVVVGMLRGTAMQLLLDPKAISVSAATDVVASALRGMLTDTG
ncbi:MAG TPA: TetR/AcrR family transcriptional regulator [Mycobacterium sp.]|nr:TetR/AcrR family transcriptional regulator [Mycobacterium sp.]